MLNPTYNIGSKFNKTFRIYHKKNFEDIFTCGKTIICKYFKLYVLKNIFNYARIGIVVGKRISKLAVCRNYIKRSIREIFRANQSIRSQSWDIVIVANKFFDYSNRLMIKNILSDCFDSIANLAL